MLQASTLTEITDNGVGVIWWTIVIAYFVIDVALVLAYIYIGKNPLGKPMPENFPFWYLGIDTAILVFLLHLAFICVDAPIYHHLQVIGLSLSYPLFLVCASLWALIAGMRYISLRRLYLKEE